MFAEVRRLVRLQGYTVDGSALVVAGQVVDVVGEHRGDGAVDAVIDVVVGVGDVGNINPHPVSLGELGHLSTWVVDVGGA